MCPTHLLLLPANELDQGLSLSSHPSEESLVIVSVSECVCPQTKPIKWGVIYLGHATQLSRNEHPWRLLDLTIV